MSKSDGGHEAVRSEFANDPDMAELIEYFVSEMPKRVDAIDACLRDNRMDELRRLAHQLKGASAGYGFSPIGDAARRLESDLDGRAALDRIRADVDQLVGLCQRVSL